MLSWRTPQRLRLTDNVDGKRGLLVAYLPQVDLEWIASDMDRRLAAFSSGGEGAIPWQVLDPRIIDVDEVGRQVDMLPVLCSGGPGDERDAFFVSRGFYVFDWTDIYRPQRLNRGYELVGTPDIFVSLTSLPSMIQTAASKVVFPHRFADFTFIEIADYFS